MTPVLIETARVADGQVPLWRLHLARLTRSAVALGIPLPATLPGVREVAAAAAGIPGPVAAVRLALRDGAASLEARAVAPAPSAWGACLAPAARRPSPLLAHKSAERAEHDAALSSARAHGCDEAVWVDARGRLTEGTITNLFMLRNGRLLTPASDGWLLPGIARRRLLDAGRLSGLAVVEADLAPADLAAADEAFLTNAVRGAIPIAAWEGVALPQGGLWREASRIIFGDGQMSAVTTPT